MTIKKIWIPLLFVLFISCSNEKKIKLLSYEKQKCEESSALTDTLELQKCMQWQLDSVDIMEILKSSEPASFREINIVCSVLPCEYAGEVIIEGKLYKYWINAGGFTALWRNNNTSYLIYDKESDFFLEELWNPETEEAKMLQIEKNTTSLNDKINLMEILKYYEHTSGVSNKPELISDYDTTKKSYYGNYTILDKKSKLIPPIIAGISVSFEKYPWSAFDTTQKILTLCVYDRLFKFNPFSFAVGDSIGEIDTSFIKQTMTDDIYYYKGKDCCLAIRQKDGIISSYMIWLCSNSINEIEKNMQKNF